MLIQRHRRAYTRPAPITPATSARLARRPAAPPRRRPTSHRRTTDRRLTSPMTVYDNRCEIPFADPPLAPDDPISFSLHLHLHPVPSSPTSPPPAADRLLCARASDARIRRVYLFYVFLHTSFKTRLSTCRGRTVARRPPRIAVPSSSSFSLLKSPLSAKSLSARCYLQSARNLSLFVDPFAARYSISSFSLTFAQASSMYKAPQNWRKMDIHIFPLAEITSRL